MLHKKGTAVFQELHSVQSLELYRHIAMVTQVATQRLCGFLSVYESLKLVTNLL